MPGRKPLYQSEAERPVTLCVRVPRDVYEQVQNQMDMRRMTLTEAALDALRLWVKTPADPRDPNVSNNSHTIVLQEFEARIDARLEALEAALATLQREALASTEASQPSPAPIPYDNSNIYVIQESNTALPSDETPQRKGYGALASQVQAYAAQQAQSFTCAEAAKAVGATPKQVHLVLARLVKQGRMHVEGSQRHATYMWLGY